MKLTELQQLVAHGESDNLELKNSTGGLSSGMQTVCAFLNSKEGGKVIFGVKDDGKIVGQLVTDKTRKEIAIELNKIEPYARIDIIYLTVHENLQVIIFDVHGDDYKAPFTYDGRPFVRNQSTTMRMPKEEYWYLHSLNNQTVWEGLTHNNCTIEDLDHNLIKEVVHTAVFAKRLPSTALSESITDILTKFNLLIDGKLKNAAVILFCKNETKLFMQQRVQLARFKGTDKKEFLDMKMYESNAFELYDKIIDYLHFCLPVAARIEPGRSERIETPAIPYDVLREAVTNALIHRDYSVAGGAIFVAVYDDRVNITNIGALPKGIILSKLSIEHTSIQRNPLIAHVFYLCGKIEKWGKGTLDMIKDCQKIGNPIPEYEEIGGSFSVTLRFKESIDTFKPQVRPTIDVSKLTKRQQQIVSLLQIEPLTRQELMAKMDIGLTDRTMQLELAKLKDMQIITSTGKSSAIIWSIL